MDWRNHPPFCHLGDKALGKVANAMRERRFQDGDIVFHEGEEGHSLYLITSGLFEAYLTTSGLGTEHVVSEMGAGDLFGEVAVLGGGSRSASVRCREAGSARELDRADFLEILENEPKAAVHLAVQLARTLQKVSPLQGGVIFHDLDRRRDYAAAAGRIHRRISRLCRALVLEETAHEASIAMVDPADANARDFLAGLVKPRQPTFLAITEEDFAWYAAAYLRETIDAAAPEQEFRRLVYASGESVSAGGRNDATSELHAALCLALGTGASDLHMEPGEDGSRFRLRIDGRLIECSRHPRAMADQIVSRLKILCELDITRKRLPQDGSLSVFWDGKAVDIRASFVPCVNGEKVVLRLLGENPGLAQLSHIASRRGVANALRELFLEPNGLILVTGPTGSGKTTTLYAALRSIWEHDQSINIVTIEDPVDCKLPFASQIQIDPASGLTFARALRAVLRQDPNVILVGEIRDAESAEIAVQAAGTGHLVLSTLHTHSAIDAISRLKKLGIEPWMLASVLRGVVAQRLVRALAPGLSEFLPVDENIRAALVANGVLPADWREPLAHAKDAESESGRLALLEILRVSPAIRAALEADLPAGEIAARAGRKDFLSFADYAGSVLRAGLAAPSRIAACFPGRTSLELEH